MISMPVSPEDAVNAYVNEPMVMVVIDLTLFSSVKPSEPIEAYADFVITLENNQSVTLSVTENDLPSNVFIDTISPRIELVGDQNHTVYVGTQNPIIPGATAYDGSPEYSASYSTSITGNLNTSIIGSNVTYTYTAHLDAAGNLGESVTRNVAVVDYTPITVTDLIANSDNSVNNSYAKVGDKIELEFTHDATIENVTGDILGDENFTFIDRRQTITITKIINQNDINGNLTFDIFVSNSSGYAARITQDDLTSSDIIIDTDTSFAIPVRYQQYHLWPWITIRGCRCNLIRSLIRYKRCYRYEQR